MEVDELSTEQNIANCINQNAAEIANVHGHTINNAQFSDMVDTDSEEVWMILYYN